MRTPATRITPLAPAALICALSCGGSHATVPDPPVAVIIALDHEEAFVEQGPEGGISHAGYSEADAFAIYDFFLDDGSARTAGPCSFAEFTPSMIAGAPEMHFVDVGTVDVQIPTRTVTLQTFVDPDAGPSIGVVPSPNEWNDGDTVRIRGAGNATFPPFERAFRVASKIEVTSPTSPSYRTKMSRGRDLVVKWSSADLEQDAVVIFYVTDWANNDFQHQRSVRCRGSGGALVVPASVIAFVSDPPWSPTTRGWRVVAERLEKIATERGTVILRSRTPFLGGGDWTPIDFE